MILKSEKMVNSNIGVWAEAAWRAISTGSIWGQENLEEECGKSHILEVMHVQRTSYTHGNLSKFSF